MCPNLNPQPLPKVKLGSDLARHNCCFWCDMPLPDCVCPISRVITEAANDNTKYEMCHA